jgi:hypothetical protein
MTHDPSSFKQVAVLTGLTALIGGAEISNADAATITQHDNFDFSSSLGATTTKMLPFNGFNTALGELTAVQLQLDSSVILPPLSSATTSVELFGTLPSSPSPPNSPNPATFNNISAVGFLDFGDGFTVDGLSGGATLADYIGSFSAVLSLKGGNILGDVRWAGVAPAPGHPEGLTVTYTYTPAVPLPATLPLFAGGLAGLGFMTWRSRRKQTAKE